MDYKFLINDLNLNKSQKVIGTDKGLAKIGDGIVNLAYSVAKSIYLTNNNQNDKIIRTGKKVSKTIPAVPAKKIEGRVSLLEKQVKYLMSKIDDFDIKIANLKSPTMVGTSGSLSEIKNVIISKVSPGDSMLIDELLDIKALKKYSITSIKKAVIELIDDEYFDVSEGSSKTKLEGNIGRLIRR